MKNDNHVWDNKLPTAQMLGRWQPWHAGHQKLFEEILKKTGQVNIMVRDVKGVDDNPFDFETVKKNIFEALKEYKNRIKIILKRLNESLDKDNLKDVKKLIEELGIACPESGSKNWTDVKQFNLMLSLIHISEPTRPY